MVRLGVGGFWSGKVTPILAWQEREEQRVPPGGKGTFPKQHQLRS